MAAATAMVSSSVVAAPLAANKFTSSAAFGGSHAQFAPIRNVNVSGSRIVAVKANYSEEEPSLSKKVLTSVLAAGVAITLAGSAIAASGPGGDGAERTSRKADELLQGADDLVNQDSPPRFGPGRGIAGDTSAEKISQTAGSGIDTAKGKAADIKGKADQVVAPAKSTSGGFFGKIKQQAKGIQGAVASKGEELKKSLGN